MTFKVGELLRMDVCRRLKGSGKRILFKWVGTFLITNKSFALLFDLERKTGVVSTKYEIVNPQFFESLQRRIVVKLSNKVT